MKQVLRCAVLCLTVAGCDPPVPGPVGGVVLIIRTEAAARGSRFAEIARIELEYERIEAVVRASSGLVTHTTVDSEVRFVVLENVDDDTFVAQLQVPVGELEQLRFFPRRVGLVLSDGTRIDLPPDTAALPSWAQTGWKLVPANGVPFPIVENELTGVRGLFLFDDRVVRPGSESGVDARWKLKPTLPAERFEPNPAQGRPGVYFDRLLVVFHDGTSRATVDAINAPIGATVLLAPISTAAYYRIRIPVTQNLETATAYYDAQPDVLTVLPAVDLTLRQRIPAEGAQPNHDLSRFPFAWELAQARGGAVGSHQVSVAVIDTGIDVTHPDLRLNIGINQGELPEGLFGRPADVAAHDCDPDGVITMRDLECDAGIRPTDLSFGDPAVLDALDVLNDPRWADDFDGDDDDSNPDTFEALLT